MSTISKRNTDKIDVLLKQDRQLFHIADLQLLWNISNKQTARQTISRLLKKGVLIQIYRGFYSTLPLNKIDEFSLGTAALHTYCYISTETVLVNNGIIFQALDRVTFCATKTKRLQIGDQLFHSRQLRDEFLYNDTGISVHGNYKIASTERAIADLRYFNPLSYFDADEHIDWKKVKQIQREVGYL